jgi:superoxide dismutase, Fe-Mn family
MSSLDRRALLAGSAALAVGLGFSRAFAQAPAQGPFTLPPLAYPANALEPHIDARTMEIHHDRHHAAYVSNLNAALKDHPQVAQMPIEQMLAKLGELPESIRTVVRNNGGGHTNHTMFWQIMGKDGGQPDGALKAAIDRDFGGLDKLQDQFNTAGTRVFGSGWVFVTVAPGGKLAIVPSPTRTLPCWTGRRCCSGTTSGSMRITSPTRTGAQTTSRPGGTS